jgi:hypothetical protein
MTTVSTFKKGYLILRTPLEEDDLYRIKEELEEENDESIFSINEQGNKLVVGINYEEIEDVAQIASTIVYNCISLGIYSINIKYCGTEANSSANRNTKGTSNSLSSNNSGSVSFNNYLSSQFTN